MFPHTLDSHWVGYIYLGPELTFTEQFKDKEDALSELLCLKKRTNFDSVKTMEDEGMYPERSLIIEEKYKASDRTNGLYTKLNCKDGDVSDSPA